MCSHEFALGVRAFSALFTASHAQASQSGMAVGV